MVTDKETEETKEDRIKRIKKRRIMGKDPDWRVLVASAKEEEFTFLEDEDEKPEQPYRLSERWAKRIGQKQTQIVPYPVYGPISQGFLAVKKKSPTF